MASSRQRWRRLVAAMFLAAACATFGTPAAVAGPAAPAATAPSARDIAPDRRSSVDQGMRLDRREKVFETTAYQTLLVAGLVGGAAVVGGIAAGAPGAITGGTAVFLLYLFMP